MSELTELTLALQDNAQRQKTARERFEKEINTLTDEQAAWTVRRQLILNNVNPEHVSVAEKILQIQGNPSNSCEGHQLTKLAANDIASGLRHIRKQYFGNKRYDRYYQRNDCEYGYGPAHGSIVESIGLVSSYRAKELSSSEIESCIYYLLNFEKIFKAKKEAA